MTGVAGAFQPHGGTQYLYSDRADITYKRIKRDATVPGGGGTMTFFTSYDTEPNWDFVFVEVHDLDANTWQTVPMRTATRTQAPATVAQRAGMSCTVADPVPGSRLRWCRLERSPGRSAGWEPWAIDLAPFAGHDVEIYFSYVRTGPPRAWGGSTT